MPVVICGSLAGAMTVDAAVAAPGDVAQSQTRSSGAVPTPSANVVLTVLGPIIVALTFVGEGERGAGDARLPCAQPR